MLSISNGVGQGIASVYVILKLDCEYLARMFYNDHGLRTTCLRYFNVYGPRQDPGSAYAAAIPIFFSRAREGKDIVIYGDGGQTRDFVHVSDVVRANVAAMEHGEGMCLMATGASVTILELAQAIVKSVGTGVGIMKLRGSGMCGILGLGLGRFLDGGGVWLGLF